MNRFWSWGLPAMIAPGLFAAPAGGAAAEYEGASWIPYHGYDRCISLQNGDCRVVLGHQFGGRPLEYSLNGINALYLSDEEKGYIYDPAAEKAANPTAGRFDIGPEKIVPPRPNLWLGQWTAEIVGPHQARLTSVEDEATGVQLIRNFTLADSGSKLICEQIIKNISAQTQKYCHWSRTFGNAGGVCVVPLTPGSRYPKNYILYRKGDNAMLFMPDDPNIVERNGCLLILAPPEHPKMGFDTYAGWLAYAEPNGLLFVKRYPTYPDRVYGEMAGFPLCVYYVPEFIELEPIGPWETIQPGGQASFTEEWELFPFESPKQGAEIDLAKVKRLAAAK